jgi:hypothetical protein
MPTLKKHTDFASMKADKPQETSVTPQIIAQRHEAWFEFIKAAQKAKRVERTKSASHGKQQC